MRPCRSMTPSMRAVTAAGSVRSTPTPSAVAPARPEGRRQRLHLLGGLTDEHDDVAGVGEAAGGGEPQAGAGTEDDVHSHDRIS